MVPEDDAQYEEVAPVRQIRRNKDYSFFFLCNLTVSLFLISYSYIITINKLWGGSTLNKLLLHSTRGNAIKTQTVKEEYKYPFMNC